MRLMEENLLRISTINYFDILLLTEQLNKTHNNTSLVENTKELSDSQIKQYFLEIGEELESCNIITHYNAISRLLLAFVINKNFNFLLEDNIETNFDINLIQKSIEYGVFEDLIKNLNYFITKFSEFPKRIEIINFVKARGDELEDLNLRLIKLSTIHKFLPTRDLLCLHYIYITILFSNSIEEENADTCRKIEKIENNEKKKKKEKNLNRENLLKLLKPDGESPKYFFLYEKANLYIEKFYRKNIIKKEKSDLERVVIVNILKLLLFTIENITNTTTNYEYARNYVPEGKIL